NDLRTEMFLDAENTLKEHINDHIFYLEEPTGAGKSNTALNLSFQIIKKVKNINKIFYIYPFNTLVDQNIENLGKIFGNQKDIMNQIAVVNSLVPMKEEKDEYEDKTKNSIRKFFLTDSF
ncbi:MAG: DEAD/DEAH box helicase family protein, partial [Anaerobutyricum sp.]